jgi:hypothetical protein
MEIQMNYINAQDLDKLLLDNEAQNLYFDKLKIVYKYELQDIASGGGDGVQAKEQNAYKLKVNNQDVIVTIDEYKDYAPFYMVLPVNDKNILEIKSTQPEIHSVNVERQRVNAIATKKVGGYVAGKPYGNAFFGNDVLQKQFAAEVATLVEEHMNRYEKQFTSKMSEVVNLNKLTDVAAEDPQIADQIAKITVGNKLFLSKLAGTFENNLEKAFTAINAPYQEGLKATEQQRQQIAESQRVAEQEERKRSADLQAFVVVQAAKEFTLEKFGYAPVVEFKANELTVTFNNKDDVKLDSFTFPLKDVEIDYYSEKSGEQEYLHVRVLEDNATDSLTTEQKKKYFHALFDLKAGLILNDKKDLPYLDEVIDKHVKLLPEDNDEILYANDQNGLVKTMKVNFSMEGRLNHVNSELEKAFPKPKKLKM